MEKENPATDTKTESDTIPQTAKQIKRRWDPIFDHPHKDGENFASGIGDDHEDS